MNLFEMFDSLDKPTLSPDQLAEKYNVSVDRINHELAKGIKVESEHTSDRAVAEEIALDHLNEKLDYYERLSAAENENNSLTLIDALRDFLPIAVKNLKLDHIPKIKLVKSIPDANVPTFGRFVNEEKIITVVVANRNPVDILRTLAHEMVHYAQGEQHRLDGDSWHTGSPIENEAHEVAGIIMREFDKQFPEYLSADPVLIPESKQRLDAKCWKGYKKQGTKMKGDTRVNNCVPVEEDWQKVNKRDKTDGMSKKAVAAYRKEHPGSKLKTAVTTKPSKLKKGSADSKRRSSYCARSLGQKKMHNIDCTKTPDKAICKARKRWNC